MSDMSGIQWEVIPLNSLPPRVSSVSSVSKVFCLTIVSVKVSANFHTEDQLVYPSTGSCSIMELELRNVELRAGDKLKLEGMVLEDADRFQIDLGCDPEDLSLHFNPRFHDDTDGRVIVCNSFCDGCWGAEQRDTHNPFHRGEHVKVTVKVMEAGFEVELPGGKEIHFPDRRGLETMTYIRVRGQIKLFSFKICWGSSYESD